MAHLPLHLRHGHGPRGWHAQWLRIVLVVLTALPLAVYIFYVLQFGVNIPWWDEWAFVPILHSMLTGHLTFAQLWAQHNEDRILFPNLIELVLASLTRYNVEVELIASAGFQVLTFLAIALLYRRRHVGPAWGLIPVSAMLFSLVQSYNMLSGFALLWSLGLFGLALAVVALDHLPGHWWALPVALIGAVLASYSGFQGLLVWPAALPYLVDPGTTWRTRGIWTGLGAVAWLVYFAGLNLQPSGIGGSSVYFALEHPLAAGRYLLVLVGSVIPVPLSTATFLVGGVILALSAVAFVWSCTSRRVRTDPALRFPAALLIYGVLFALATTVGRSSFGTLEATSPRYTTSVLVLLTGLYLVLLRWSRHTPHQPTMVGSTLLGTCGLIIAVQFVASMQSGWQTGPQARSARLLAADLVVNLDRAPPSLVQDFVYPYPGPFLPAQVNVLERYHLSIFGTPAASVDARLGVVPGGALARSLEAPPSVEQLLRRSRSDARAWAILSTIYESRGDLQAAFPRRSVPFALSLLRWATTSGVGSDGDSVFLRPYRSELDQLLQAATSSAS